MDSNRDYVDDIEGHDDSLSEPNEGYPLDDIMIRSERRTVSDVVKRIKLERFQIDPDFQRNFIWEAARQSKLIESCIMRIPIPVLYVAEGEDGRIIVVDGLQRLSTFVRFIDNKLKLSGLGEKHPLKDMRFEDLPIHLKERVEDTQLTLYILDSKAPPRAKLDIFERVNSGLPLTKQQMRNALYSGVGTTWLAKMAEEEAFLSATNKTLNWKTMRDREAINRFAAFRLFGYNKYTNGDMDEFLAKALESLNGMGESWLAQLTRTFKNGMRANYFLFKTQSFRRSLTKPTGKHSVINISLFDVLSTSMSLMPRSVVEENRNDIRNRVIELLENEEFAWAITRSTNGTQQVQTRYEMARDSLGQYQIRENLD